MSADLGLVVDAAERHAHELAVQCAGDRLADRGLPGAGRTDQRQDRAGALVLLDPAILPKLAHGEVLDDAVLDVLQAGMIRIEHLTRVAGVQPLLRALSPRDGQQPVEIRADHLRLAALVAHALEAARFALCLLSHGVRHPGFGDLRPVVLGGGPVVLAELLANRVHLPPQDVFALLLLGAGFHVVANAPTHLQLCETLTLQAQCKLETLDDVDLREQLDLLGEGDVGGVRSRVRERAGTRDRADEVVDPSVGLAQVEDLLDHRAILALELGRLDTRRLLVGPLVDLDAQTAVGAGLGSAGDPAVPAGERRRPRTAGQPDDVGGLGDRADVGVDAVVDGDEQDPLAFGHVDRQRHGHVREDHGFLERDQQHLCQVSSFIQSLMVLQRMK